MSKPRRGRPPKDEENRTRELILDAAESIIVNQGPDSLRLQQIANAVGIRVPTIYGHFKNGREGVLYAIGERYIVGMAQQFQYNNVEDPKEALMRGTRQLVLYLAANPAHVKLSLVDLCSPRGTDILNAPAGGDSLEILTKGPLSVMYNRLDELLGSGKKIGVFQNDVNVVRFLRSVMGAALISLTWPTHSTLGAKDSNTAEVERIMKEIEDLAIRLVTVL